MNEHIRIRGLLALYLTNSLSREEEAGVDQHLPACSDCRAELATLRMIAVDLKSMPPPQPSFGLAQRTRARIAGEMAAKAERRQHQRMLAWVIGFAWIFTGLTVRSRQVPGAGSGCMAEDFTKSLHDRVHRICHFCRNCIRRLCRNAGYPPS